MASQNYAAALKRVLAHEGGYVNHPADPGGATMRGVTQRVYDGYRRRTGTTPQPVAKISDDELTSIYHTQYATPIRFDDLPPGVDYCVFDGAVNSGPAQSVKWLQRALGLKADGVVGNVTIEKATAHPDKAALVVAICDQRMAFLRQLSTFATFGKGWTSRVTGVRQVATQMARGQAVAARPMALMMGGESAPALVADVAKPSAPVVGPTIGAGGGSIAIFAQTAQDLIDQGKEQLYPFSGSLHIVDQILTALTIAGFALAAGGLAYGVYAAIRRRQIKAAIGPTT